MVPGYVKEQSFSKMHKYQVTNQNSPFSKKTLQSELKTRSKLTNLDINRGFTYPTAKCAHQYQTMQDTVFQGWTENIGNYGAKMVERFGDWFKPVYNDGRTNDIVAEGTTRGTNLIGGTGVTQWWNKGPDGVYRAMTEAGFRTDD